VRCPSTSPSAFPSLRGLGKLAQIGDLGQVEIGQVVDHVYDVGGAGGVGYGRKGHVVLGIIWCKSLLAMWRKAWACAGVPFLTAQLFLAVTPHSALTYSLVTP
jgi:hypothetical protein